MIERSQQVTHVYRETRLSIAMARSGGGRLWHAAFRQDEREPRAVSPADAVWMLLERLPRHDSAKAAAERQRHALCAGATPAGLELPAAADGVAEAESGVEQPSAISCPKEVPAPPGERTRPSSAQLVPA